jgi:hypothetical protein
MSAKSSKSGATGRRKPHNAQSIEYVSFKDLLAQIAGEPRTARVGDEQVTMARGDRLLRLLLDRALQGKVREVIKLLQLMAKYPNVAATFREENVIVMSGAMCRVG